MLEAFKEDQYAILNQGIRLLGEATGAGLVRKKVPGTKAEVKRTNAERQHEAFWYRPNTIFSKKTEIEAYIHDNSQAGESGIRIVKNGLTVTEKPGFIRTLIWNRRVRRTMAQISVGGR